MFENEVYHGARLAGSINGHDPLAKLQDHIADCCRLFAVIHKSRFLSGDFNCKYNIYFSPGQIWGLNKIAVPDLICVGTASGICDFLINRCDYLR